MANRVAGQPMFKLLQEAQALERSGKDIIHFELGDPDFETPANISNEAIKAIKNGHTHYAPSRGIYEFQEAIQKTTYNSRGFEPCLDQVLVTPGGNPVIFLSIACSANPGDEVIVPDPGFPTYFSAIKACGAKSVSVKLHEKNNFELQADDVIKSVTKKTKLIIINSPSNPTGACMQPEQIDLIAEYAIKNNIYLLSDEIYARLILGGDKFYSPGHLDNCKKNIIILNGFSKAFAMTGWRLGVAIGPQKIIDKMNLMLNTIVSCVPPFIQYAGIEALEGDQRAILEMRDKYQDRRDIFIKGLNSIKGISCNLPKGAMYAFFNITGTGLTSDQFARKSLHEAGVALLPGNCFGVYGEGYARVTFANSSANIQEGIKRLQSTFGIK
ncbi:pyridoxal phosphate-dependent aminotransferase [Gammaproteobacteria bacterium]|nr:pyridoxal phosphate-dependent aminotransferase [Gammaproteobacteria bacterium]